MHRDRDGGHSIRASPLEHSPPKAQRRHPSAARAETVTSARTASTSAKPGIAHLRCEKPTTKPEGPHEVSAPDQRAAPATTGSGEAEERLLLDHEPRQ